MTTASKNQKQKDMEAMLKKNMEQIDQKILVLSNKGGVGKSSVAASIAVILNHMGKKVGILDADIHGPSMVKMMGQEGKMLSAGEAGIEPLEAKPNLKMISMAALSGDQDNPVIWRGPMKMTALKQFLAEVNWGNLNYLVIDSPPGTGDEPLSICQLIPELAGAIIVTTPQDIALLDSRKCVSFLKQLKIPVLGILENMSTFSCPHCGKEIDLFKSGGGEKAAKELGIDLLGEIPFDAKIVESVDKGEPFVEMYPESEAANVMLKVTRTILGKIHKNKLMEPDSGFDKFSDSLQETIMREVREKYSEKVIDHWQNPRNFKKMKNADFQGKLTGPCGDTMKFYLKMDGARVTEASFFTDGCGTTIACGSAVVELVKGKTLEEVRKIDQNTVLDAMGGLPEENAHCALLAANTLKQTLDGGKNGKDN